MESHSRQSLSPVASRSSRSRVRPLPVCCKNSALLPALTQVTTSVPTQLLEWSLLFQEGCLSTPVVPALLYRCLQPQVCDTPEPPRTECAQGTSACSAQSWGSTVVVFQRRNPSRAEEMEAAMTSAGSSREEPAVLSGARGAALRQEELALIWGWFLSSEHPPNDAYNVCTPLFMCCQ